MGNVCCSANDQEALVVEELPSSIPDDTNHALAWSKDGHPKTSDGSCFLSEPKGAPQQVRANEAMSKGASHVAKEADVDEERMASIGSFGTITFTECDSSLDPDLVAQQMKERADELSETQECPSLQRLISRGNSLLSGRNSGRSSFCSAKPDFTGVWKCIDTYNLDEFLRACGVNKLQRMAACKAPWPWWSMEHELDRIHFINHGPLGEVEECIDLAGKEYISYDGKKQKMTNKASWEGATLVIVRDGPLGIFREERTLVDGDKLAFKLTIQSGPNAGGSWGRTFQRADQSCVKEGSKKTWMKTWSGKKA
jgi:hypothetical protein